MLTVIDYAVRQNSEGEPFVALMLQGDLEMVQSQETGRFYATARKSSVPAHAQSSFRAVASQSQRQGTDHEGEGSSRDV